MESQLGRGASTQNLREGSPRASRGIHESNPVMTMLVVLYLVGLALEHRLV